MLVLWILEIHIKLVKSNIKVDEPLPICGYFWASLWIARKDFWKKRWFCGRNLGSTIARRFKAIIEKKIIEPFLTPLPCSSLPTPTLMRSPSRWRRHPRWAGRRHEHRHGGLQGSQPRRALLCGLRSAQGDDHGAAGLCRRLGPVND